MKRLGMFTFILSMAFLLAVSCKEDDPGPVYGQIQNPMAAFVGDLDLNQTTVNSGSNWEFGSTMQFNKNGLITDLCLKLPDDGSHLITLWDMSDTSLILSVNISADSGQYVCNDIPDIAVTSGDRYALTLNSRDYYLWVKPAGGSLFPVTKGDVDIVAFNYQQNPTGTVFPMEEEVVYYSGLSDLVFKPLLE